MIWIALFILLVISGIVSGAETAVFSLPRRTLLEFERSRHRLERGVARLMRSPQAALMTVLFANTAINVVLYAVSYVAFAGLRNKSQVVGVTAGALVLLANILVGEVGPKALALAHARLFAVPAGTLISALHVVLGPVQGLLSVFLVNPIVRLLAPARRQMDTVTTEELQLLVERSAREGYLSSTENELLQSVVALGDVRVREIMTPRVDIEYLHLDDHPRNTLNALKKSSRRILPVCGRDLDDIRGAVYVRDPFLNPQAPLRGLLRPVHFVPEQVRLTQLMRSFHANQAHFAIVVDEYGGTAGMVTMEDVVEWIVGDLPDYGATRTQPIIERQDQNTYLLAGDLSIREWAETFAVKEIDGHVDTLGGLVLSLLGRLPRKGDEVRIRNLSLTVESMRGRRIQRVLLRRVGEGAPTAGGIGP